MTAVATAAASAGAAINYNVLQATIGYNNGDSNSLDVNINGDTISFSSNPAMIVGAGGEAGHLAAVITIIYTVESDKPLTGLDLMFGGQAFNRGDVSYTELVENWNANSGSGTVIASTNGDYKGSGFQGGNDDPFTNDTFLDFKGSVFSYKVKKTFTLTDLDSDPAGGTSFATIGSIDQTAVPEPATMSALAIGALGLLARRRRK